MDEGMNNEDYWVLKVENIPSHLEEEVSACFFSIGAIGVHEDLFFEQKTRGYLPEVVDTETRSILVYFESVPAENDIVEVQKEFPEIAIQKSREAGKDWLAEWKKGWEPFLLTLPYWVVPSWHRATFSEPGAECIYIDPGMAFGTGTHATTQLAAHLVCESVRSQKITKSVDVGTGSGILALLLEKEGVQQIEAFDIDAEAERVFNENLELNGCHRAHWNPRWDKEGPYDFIVANIIDGVLIDLAPLFRKNLTVGGRIVFSGVLLEREKEFLKEIGRDWELEMEERLIGDEWLGYLFVRKA